MPYFSIPTVDVKNPAPLRMPTMLVLYQYHDLLGHPRWWSKNKHSAIFQGCWEYVFFAHRHHNFTKKNSIQPQQRYIILQTHFQMQKSVILGHDFGKKRPNLVGSVFENTDLLRMVHHTGSKWEAGTSIICPFNLLLHRPFPRCSMYGICS